MKHLVLAGALLSAWSAATAAHTTSSAGQRSQGAAIAPATILGTVRLTKNVMADGKSLPAATYQVRLSNDEVKPVVGQAPEGERWVEFVTDGRVAGREMATVISADDMGKIAKGRQPKTNSSLVELLKGGDYWRVWINKNGTNYIINLPPAT